MLRQEHLIAVVTVLIGCAVLLIVVGCAGTSSESSKKEQGSSSRATQSEEEARCQGTRTTKNPSVGSGGGGYTTNDLPGCPSDGLLLGTDKKDRLAGKDDDKISGLGGKDLIFEGDGNDIIYAGPGDDGVLHGDGRDEGDGDDVIYGGSGDEVLEGGKGVDDIYGEDGSDSISDYPDGQRDKPYCGEGKDRYVVEKKDFVSSSCEKKVDIYASPPRPLVATNRNSPSPRSGGPAREDA